MSLREGLGDMPRSPQSMEMNSGFDMFLIANATKNQFSITEYLDHFGNYQMDGRKTIQDLVIIHFLPWMGTSFFPLPIISYSTLLNFEIS
jgi:hypothetical protein